MWKACPATAGSIEGMKEKRQETEEEL